MRPEGLFNMSDVFGAKAGSGIVRRAFVTRDATGGESASATITTADVDREGDTIDPDGIDTTAYEQNPVVLWAHDAKQPPIARAERLVRVGRGLRATWRWASTEAAQTIRKLWDEKMLNAISIGFWPRRSQPNEHGGRHHSEIELLEFSVVPVPANPAAVRALKSLGLNGGPSLEQRIERAVASVARDVAAKLAGLEVDERPGLDAAKRAREAAALIAEDVLHQVPRGSWV
jgi:HK97 family phage prohead protease